MVGGGEDGVGDSNDRFLAPAVPHDGPVADLSGQDWQLEQAEAETKEGAR